MEENNSKSGYGNNSWGKWLAIYGVAAILIYGGYYFLMPKNRNYSQTTNTNNNSVTTTPATVKFQDSPLASKAFLIYPGVLSTEAKQAIAGFKIDSQIQADGSAIISLTSSNPGYTDQQVTVKSGYSLYFIEKSSGDDSPTNDTDQTTIDDKTVLVDPAGFIVQ
jgi:hypothetical protein